MTIEEILSITKGELICGDRKRECVDFEKDTRTLKKGDTYIGIKGGNFDGSKFWKQAIENGAETVIVENVEISEEEKKEFYDKAIIIVEDTLEALYKIAAYKRIMSKIPVIAITGSVGKTSTKDVIGGVVSQKYKTHKTAGNLNNNIGMPFTILGLKDEEIMVLEMGMNNLGEISLLSEIAKPDICVITNVGTAHIGNLGSRENILKAKLEILDGNPKAKLIINNDNDMLSEWYSKLENKKNIFTIGIDNKSEYMPEDIKLNESNSIVKYKNEEITVPVQGKHFVLNALVAIAIGEILDINLKNIKNGIETFELTKNRMEVLENSEGIKVINDAYNASYESMSASLSNLGQFKNRKIAVLGDMFELGQFSEKLHYGVGKEVIANNIDILLCSGENSKNITNGAIENGMSKECVMHFDDKESLLEKLENIIRENDIILLKASNGMKFHEISSKLKEKYNLK